jgi:lipoyl(octanoyl) transferase
MGGGCQPLPADKICWYEYVKSVMQKNVTHRCGLIKSGLVSYEVGLILQDQAKTLIASGEWDGILILLEHLPVITVGNGGGKENLRMTDRELRSQGIDVVSTDRGGSITCHNPGQLVGYPVLHLDKWQKDVHWYVHMLEEVLIRTLAHYGLKAGRKARYTGVWLEDEKIAAIGVSVKQWVTGHGFAFNINNNLELFQVIIPCGIREFGVTSLQHAGVKATVDDVAAIITEEFADIFNCRLARGAIA